MGVAAQLGLINNASSDPTREAMAVRGWPREKLNFRSNHCQDRRGRASARRLVASPNHQSLSIWGNHLVAVVRVTTVMDVVDRSNGTIGFTCANLLPNLHNMHCGKLSRLLFLSILQTPKSERHGRCYGVVTYRTSLVGVRQNDSAHRRRNRRRKGAVPPFYELSAIEPPSLASMSLLLGISYTKTLHVINRLRRYRF